jgi:hypothetical protein
MGFALAEFATLFLNGSFKMEKITTTISKTVAGTDGKNVREKIGEVGYLQPTLADFGITGTEVRDEKTNELEGYTEKPLDWLYSAVCAATRSALTTRLENQSVEYKAGQSAWTNLEELITSAGGAKGAHFIVKREFKEAFNAFADSLGKSAGFTANLKALAILPVGKNTTPALAAIDANTKAIFLKRLNQFIATLSDEDAVKYGGICEELSECCETVSEGLTDE